MLYRMHKTPAASGTLDGFSDASAVSAWAKDAVQWAVECGILQGSNGKIKPKGNATREQVAAFLVRYMAYAKSNPVMETEPDEDDTPGTGDEAPSVSPAPSPEAPSSPQS